MCRRDAASLFGGRITGNFKEEFDARVADARQSVERGEREKEVARLRDTCERVRRFVRAKLSESFDDVIAHVCVRVFERADERGRGARVALLSERERRLHA